MDNYKFDRERWARLSIFEQMGNIGSEVGRAIIAHRNGNAEREARAVDRAIDLFSATVEVLIGTPYSYRLKEILRARDEFLRLFFDGTFEEDADNIDRYFTYFAVAARAMHYAGQSRDNGVDVADNADNAGRAGRDIAGTSTTGK